MWPFKRQTISLPVKIQLIARDITKLRLNDWKSDDKLVSGARAVLSGDYAKLMLEVLRNEHPAFQVFHPECSLETRALQQARAEGYTLCLANFEAMGAQAAKQVAIEATFDEEEKESATMD